MPPPPPPLDASSLLELPALEKAFEARAHRVTLSLRALLAGGTPWEGALLEAARSSRAHCHLTLLASFGKTVHTQPAGALREVLRALCLLCPFGQFRCSSCCLLHWEVL